MKQLAFAFSLLAFFLIANPCKTYADEAETTSHTAEVSTDQHANHPQTSIDHHDDEHHDHHILKPHQLSVIPFVLLLLMIATGPLFFEHFWHKNYPIVAIVLGIIVVVYYLVFLKNVGNPTHALVEYIQFIALLSSLYIASGGILIKVDKEGTPMANVCILLIGAVIANIIGTTGASMLLVRPFIRLNKNRIKAYHVVFFIFIVSNLGGSLTPIGDPPLFLGFLKGVPFGWTIVNNFAAWLFAILVLVTLFYFKDKTNKADYDGPNIQESYSGKITIIGKKNFLWLGVVIISVFLDPNVIDWVPGIPFESHGEVSKISFIREIIMLGVAFLSFKYASQDALKGNEFNFEPIREVAFLFIGIFATMMPALELISDYAKSEAGSQLINYNSLYWGTGVLSGFLDNAPTYMNFLTASISKNGGSVFNIEHVQSFAYGEGMFSGGNTKTELIAISLASVFFGAMTYIGNGPNFMVKAISEQVGVRMPSFFAYITKFSLIYLLPLLFLVWFLFFYLGLVQVFQ